MSEITGNIVEVTLQNFQEIVEKSRSLPVLLEFYAEGAEESARLAAVLQRLANEYGGKFILGRVNIQESPQIVQQLGVRTLPTLKLLYEGQLAQDLEGPQEEQQLRSLLDQVTMSPTERTREQIDLMLADGNREAAIGMLQQAIEEEPGNYGLQTELCDLLIMEDRADEAGQILAGLPDDAEGINKPRFRLEFIELAAGLGTIADLEGALSEGNLQSRFDLALRLIVDDQIEAALSHLLEIMKVDREFQEDIGRTTMIKIFDLLGKGNPIATEYRRKMFTFLH
jgi:putative thioredoxin